MDRQRQNAERKLQNDGNQRSAGEMALMFMGINQIAYDLLLENPMTGYMQEMIFSRILGHDEIEEGAYWIDSTDCWVCGKWNKTKIEYDLQKDEKIFQSSVGKIRTLNKVIDSKVQHHYKLLREKEVKDKEEEVDLEIMNVQELPNNKRDLDQDSFIVEAPEELEKETSFDQSNSMNATSRRFRPTTTQFGQMRSTAHHKMAETHMSGGVGVGPKSVGEDAQYINLGD